MSEECISIRRGGSSVVIVDRQYCKGLHCGNITHFEDEDKHISYFEHTCDKGEDYMAQQFINAHNLNKLVKVLSHGSSAEQLAYVREVLADALASIRSAQAVIDSIRSTSNSLDTRIDDVIREFSEEVPDSIVNR